MRFKSITRLGYWQGQEFRARDLRDQTGSLEQLRWWHNRAAHQVFGVSQGLQVTVDPATPQIASVGCGLAYDCFGRELIVPSATTVSIPSNGNPAAASMYLTFAYSAGSATLSFVARNNFTTSIGVPLAFFDPGAPYTKNASFRAPAARALSRPRLGAGSTVPGNTSWERLPDGSGLQVLIDTSSAGFTEPPFYLAGLNWDQLNTQFSEPVASITDKDADQFTFQLLLKDVGQELFQVVSGAGLVSTIDPNNAVTFRREVQFAQGQDFQQNDVLARLAPRANLALPISAVQGAALTLGATSPDWHQQQNEVVVLGSLPVTASVTEVLAAISIPSGAAGAYHPGSVIFRMAASAAGAAATVKYITADGTLIVATPLSGLTQGEQVGIVTPAGKVTLKNAEGTLIALDQPTDQLANAIVIRLSNQMNTETPTTVTTVNADGTLDLAASIGLKDGDELGVAKPVAAATFLSTALTLDQAASFQSGDPVGVGPAPQSNFNTVRSVDSVHVVLASTFAALTGEAVVNADFPVRTTAAAVFGALIFVQGAAAFTVGDVVAHIKGPKVVETGSVARVFEEFNAIVLVAPMAAMATGEVLALARFGRSAKVIDPGTGPTPVVQIDQPAAGRFRVGDTVARVSAAGPLELAVVGSIAANSVTLMAAIAALTAGDVLGVVSLNAAVIVAGPPPDAMHLTVDAADYARAGGVLARWSGWADASSPVTLNATGATSQLSALPDGLMIGDAIGFAALAPPAQPQIRFDASARIAAQSVSVQGVDENTGQSFEVVAQVASIDNQLATLRIIGGASFSVRPENVQITGSSQIDDFLAYAQKQGLAVSWLGCQMPGQIDRECPGVVPAPCPCK